MSPISLQLKGTQFLPTIKSIKCFRDGLIEFHGFWESTGVLQVFPISFEAKRSYVIPIGFLKTFVNGC